MNHQLEQSKHRFQVFFDQCLSLAQHVPAERQDWKPEGTGRTAKGIYEHLAAANYGFAKLIQGEEIRVPRAQRQSVALPSGSFDEAASPASARCARPLRTSWRRPQPCPGATRPTWPP